MRVCYLINQLAPGGAPTLLLDIIEQTEDADVSYTVCYIEGEDALVDDLRHAGAEVVDFDAAFKFDPRALLRMGRFFHRREFDVLHAHLPYSQTLGRLFSMIGTVDTVVSTQHNVPENYHPISRSLERTTRWRDDATVAVSEGVERAFRDGAHRFDGTLDGQWCTIYNGIDREEFSRSVRNADSSSIDGEAGSNRCIFLNVGRYVPAKSQDILIEAMASVVDVDSETHLYIVGWGEREEELRTLVDDHELDEYVTVTGRVDSVHEYYDFADVFVSSSTFEGLPITHLEAMSAELPLVTTAIPGVTEVVEDGTTGLLAPPDDPDALADAMTAMQDEADREMMGTAGYERVREHFSIEQTVENHLQLYNHLLTT